MIEYRYFSVFYYTMLSKHKLPGNIIKNIDKNADWMLDYR